MIATFKDIIGQDDAIETLRAGYVGDRLPHGMIFAGPIGVGKATTAQALGALYLCENPKNALPCKKCDSCRLFEGQITHPDYHIIVKEMVREVGKSKDAKARDMSIDVIRFELLEKASRTSVMNRGKVFVVEQAELMTNEAQNALLKTLEEPTPRTLIIMMTDRPTELLTTIRSRSRILQFVPLDDRIVREQLINRGIASKQADRAVQFASGSLGLAVRWIDEGVIDAAEDLVKRLIAIETTGDAAGLAEFLKSSADAYAEKQIERDPKASKLQVNRNGLNLYLQLASEHFTRRMNASADDPELLERFCTAIDAIAETERNIDSNVVVSLLLQQFVLSIERAFAGLAIAGNAG